MTHRPNSLAAASDAHETSERASQAAAHDPAPHTGKDVLSDVLRAVRLTGALFFRVCASSPWSVKVPDVDAFAHVLLPSAQHVISYHIVAEGSGWVGIGDDTPIEFAAGDVLVIPQGDPYIMCSSLGAPIRPESARFCGLLSRYGGGAATLRSL